MPDPTEYAKLVESELERVYRDIETSVFQCYSSTQVVPFRPRPPRQTFSQRICRTLQRALQRLEAFLESVLTKKCPDCAGWGYDDGGPGSWTCCNCGGSGRV